MSSQAITENDLREILNKLLPIKSDLLWTNPSPASRFAAQTISVDLSEYDYVEIWYYAHISHANPIQVGGVVKTDIGAKGSIQNVTGTVSDTSGNLVGDKRSFTVNTNGIVFNSGYTVIAGNTWAVNEDHAIPYKIFGFKRP